MLISVFRKGSEFLCIRLAKKFLQAPGERLESHHEGFLLLSLREQGWALALKFCHE